MAGCLTAKNGSRCNFCAPQGLYISVSDVPLRLSNDQLTRSCGTFGRDVYSHRGQCQNRLVSTAMPFRHRFGHCSFGSAAQRVHHHHCLYQEQIRQCSLERMAYSVCMRGMDLIRNDHVWPKMVAASRSKAAEMLGALAQAAQGNLARLSWRMSSFEVDACLNASPMEFLANPCKFQ